MFYKKVNDICEYLPKSSIKVGDGKKYGFDTFDTSSDKQILFYDEYLYDAEALIIGTGGSSSCNYCKRKFSSSTDNIVITSKSINVRYLYYYMRKNNLAVLQKGFYGAGLNHISKSYFGNIEVPNISIEKQNKIIEILDMINKQKEDGNKICHLLDELIKSKYFGGVNYALWLFNWNMSIETMENNF